MRSAGCEGFDWSRMTSWRVTGRRSTSAEVRKRHAVPSAGEAASSVVMDLKLGSTAPMTALRDAGFDLDAALVPRILAAQKQGVLRLVASPDGAQDSVLIHANARLYSGLFDGAQAATLVLDSSRKAYVHIVRGQIAVNGTRLVTGDAALLEHESQLRLDGANAAEVLVFDLQE